MNTDNDQATVDRLCLLTYTSDQEGEPHDCVECADAARAILDAIRNGEVPIPGMVTEAVWRGAEAECDRLRAEVERLSNERERAWQCHGGAPCGVCVTCLSGDVERLRMESDPPVCRLQLPDGRVPGNAKEAAEAWYAAASAARNERDAEKARADKAEAETRLARMELERMTAENAAQTYRGNSVSYWHQKAVRYGDLVMSIGPKLGAREDEKLVDAADRFVAERELPLRDARDAADYNRRCWEGVQAERDRLAGLLARLRHQVGKIMPPRTDCDCSDCLFMRSIDAALAEVGE